MLGAHPVIATGQESQVFEKYLRKLDDHWHREMRYPDTHELRRHGITSYVDEKKFTRLMRDFAVGVFEDVLAAKEGATIFLDKSPSSSLNIDLMTRCFPGAKYIHMIRDGRDVATSKLAARKSWGRQFAPQYAADAAAEWQEAVTECLRLREMPNSYHEIRYEELLANGPGELGAVFDFLELPFDDASVAEIYQRFSFKKLQKNDYQRDVFLNTGVATASGTADRPEPKGFFRKGISGDWKNSLTASQLAEIYWVAGETLRKLGYAEDIPPASREPWSIKRRRLAAGFKTSIRKIGKRIFS
jgi:hypothetical protein